VLSVGKHGVTVDHEGKRQSVTWGRVLGHKKRISQKLKIIHEGDDGVIVEDSAGKRRFVHIPPEAKEDQYMVKALADKRLLLFTKSEKIANRAGLHLENRTDRTGRNQKKWVRSQDETKGDKQTKTSESEQNSSHGQTEFGARNIKAGQKVQFKLGELAGEGKVVGNPGADGAHVKDSSGHIHQVRWDQVTGNGSHNSESDNKGAGDDQQSQSKLFDDEFVASLPSTVKQPHDNWEDLVKHGKEGLEQFNEMLGKVQQVMGLKSGHNPDDITDEQWGNDDGYLFIAPLKGEKRAREKVEGDYDGDWSQLRDVVRATISVPTMAQVKQAVGHLHDVGIDLAQKPKNRFEKSTHEGYRDLMAIVKLPNGMVAELQIHVKAMTQAKNHGHHHYGITRSLQTKYNEIEPSDKWSDEDHSEYYKAIKAQRNIYSEAWRKANGETKNQLTKAFLGSTIILLFRKKEVPNEHDLH
jgi:hypothetical protein